MSGYAPAPVHVESGCVGSGLSKVFGSPDRLVVASALECLGGTASVTELFALTGLDKKKIRAVLSDLEYWKLLARTHAAECRAGITAEGRRVLADHWQALGTLRSELVVRRPDLGSEA